MGVQKIIIPVQFSDTAASYKQVIGQLEAELKKVKPGTAVYDNIANSLKKAKKLSDQLDLDLSAGISSRSDISKLDKDFSKLYAALEKINEAYEDLGVKNLNINTNNFGDLATDLVKAKTQLESLQKSFKNARSMKISELFAGDSKSLSLFGKDNLTKEGLSIFDSLNDRIEKTSFQLEEATTKTKQLEAELAKLEKKQRTSGITIDPFSEKIKNITVSSGEKKEIRQKNLAKEVEQYFNKSGTWKAGADKKEVENLLKAFGLDNETVQQIIAEKVPDRLQLINDSISKITNKQFDAVHSANWKKADESARARKLQEDINKTSSSLNAQKNIQKDTSSEIAELQNQFNVLKNKLVNIGVVSQDGVSLPGLEAQIEAIEKQINELNIKIAAKGPSSSNLQEVPDSSILVESYNAQKEAELFRSNLKGAVKQWLGLREITTLVRNGIRQAYQDIQGLDQAMANIAVVTDMSIDDLWGKINEYMAVAKQYGVTTQGVYEVSQLYYQQGLSQAEVTELTTETLKLARVANMDYAASADAMTVALRGFKMEMSEAATVTDVYSEVAAITASDQAELATAMSKTASSAASVGSSFENTTAMLAVMVETTRESAQNLGSALKSIISRYGEMKVGVTVDSEGEALDYNKVDTALKSIGISLKDAQGQFRDFDDVIFELSAKWDSLDKNTQRYIATIMAGNRQQSRFIALVDNWERLDEVSKAAADSQDAGLLQYAKTMDSLETKINNIKTSFQQFYMDIFNGPFFTNLLDWINKIIEGFNKVSKITTTLNLATLIIGLKNIANILIDNIYVKFEKMFRKLAQESLTAGQQAGANYAKGVEQGQQSQQKKEKIGVSGLSNQFLRDWKKNGKQTGDKGQVWEARFAQTTNALGSQLGQLIGNAVGVGLSAWGSKITSTNQTAGLALTSVGTGVTSAMTITRAVASMSGALGAAAGPIGLVAGALIGIVSFLVSMPSKLEKAQENLEKAQKAAEEANIKRAQEQKEAKDLEQTLSNLQELQRVRHRSQEAEQEYINACSEAAEQFPYLAVEIDGTIDVIKNAAENELLLAQARQEAAEATLDAAAAELKEAYAKKEVLDEQAPKENWDNTVSNSGNIAIFTDEEGNYIGGIQDNTSVPEAIRLAYNDALRESNEILKQEKLSDLNKYVDLFSSYNNVEDFLGAYNSYKANREVNADQISAGQNAVIKSSVERTWEFSGKDQLWQEIAGAEEAFFESLYSSLKFSEKDFDEKTGELTEKASAKLAIQREKLLQEYNDFYEGLYNNRTLDDFNELYDSAEAGKYSRSDLEKELGNYENLPTELKDQILSQYTIQIENLKKYLDSTETSFGKSVWNDTLNDVPLMYQSYIADFNDYLKAQVEKEETEQGRTKATEQAKKIISNYQEVLSNIDAIPEDLQAKAQEILYTGDWTSLSGLYDMLYALKEAGITIKGIDTSFGNIIENSSYNLVTESENFLNKIATNFDNAAKAIDEAMNGLDNIADVVKMVNKLGLSFKDFEFVEGKYYLNDPLLAVENVKTNLQDWESSLLDQFDLYINAIKVNNFSLAKETSNEDLNNLINQEGLDSNLKKALQTYGQSYLDALRSGKYEGNFEEYVNSFKNNIEVTTDSAVKEYLNWYQEEAKKEFNIRKLTQKTNQKLANEVGTSSQQRLEAYQKLVSNGLEGWTVETIAELANEFGDWIYDYTKFNYDGSAVLNEGILKRINKTIGSFIQESLDEAEEELKENLTIGKKITKRSDLKKLVTDLYDILPDADKIPELLADGILSIEDMGIILSVNGENLYSSLLSYGYSLSEFLESNVETPAEILSQLGKSFSVNQLTIEDQEAYAKAITDWSQSLTNIFSGTGTATDAQKMVSIAGADSDIHKYLIKTSKGIGLSQEKFFEFLNELKIKDEEIYNTFKDSLLENPSLVNEAFVDASSVVEAMKKVQEELNDLRNEENEALKEQLSIYRQIYAQMSMNKSEGWDFLNRELEGNSENFLNWANSVQESFKQVDSEDGIDPKNFINMMEYMQKQGVAVEQLSTQYSDWASLMQASYAAMGEAATKGAGVFVKDLQISSEDMKQGILSAIKKEAQAQVKLLDGQIRILEGLKALENIDASEKGTAKDKNELLAYIDNLVNTWEKEGNFELGTIYFTYDGKSYPLTKDGWDGLYEAMKKGADGERSEFEISEIIQKALATNGASILEGAKAGGTSNVSIDGTYGDFSTNAPTELASIENSVEQILKSLNDGLTLDINLNENFTVGNNFTVDENGKYTINLGSNIEGIDITFTGEIPPDANLVNELLTAAGYSPESGVIVLQDNQGRYFTLNTENGHVEFMLGDNITGTNAFEELITALGFTGSIESKYTFTDDKGRTFVYDSDKGKVIMAKGGLEGNETSVLDAFLPALGFNQKTTTGLYYTNKNGATYYYNPGTGNVMFGAFADQTVKNDSALEELLTKLGIKKVNGIYSCTDTREGLSFNYNPETGTVQLTADNLSSDTAGLAEEFLKKIFGNDNTSLENNEITCTYKNEEGKTVSISFPIAGSLKPDYSNLTVSELTKKDIEAALDNSGKWNKDENTGEYSREFTDCTVKYSLGAGLKIVAKDGVNDISNVGDFLNTAFSDMGWTVSGSEETGWSVLDKDNKVLFKVPATVKLQSDVDKDNNEILGISGGNILTGITAEAEVSLVSSGENGLQGQLDELTDSLNPVKAKIIFTDGQGNPIESMQSPFDSIGQTTDILDENGLVFIDSGSGKKLVVIKKHGSEEISIANKEDYLQVQNDLSSEQQKQVESFLSIDSSTWEQAAEEYTTGFEKTVTENPPTAPVEADTTKAEEEIDQLIKSANEAAATINISVRFHKEKDGSISSNTGGTNIPAEELYELINDAQYAGNVSGLALYNGANFANKTLVGELGPELAVYDNMYHLLGQNGAEFVNLPDDAIVFNHRQTEGIIRGQAGYRGKALVNGNVSGPAYAGGSSIDTAIDTLVKLREQWKSILDKTVTDFATSGGGGGGGSGNTIKAHIEDLEEWYNLLRQIANLEQKISNIQAERANIDDGHEYLRSLREEQALLEKQVTTQEILLNYQQKQLKLQADQINQNKIWSQFLTVGEDGLLQYKKGNEANGGKGALEVLQDLNQMSGKEQQAFMKQIGYSYTDTDGNKLKGEELVAKFYEELQAQIDAYDELYDTVNETEETLEGLETSIREVDREILENQMTLETAVYEALVSMREKEIEQLEEQVDLIKEANEAYIDGIQKAIQSERDMYEKNEAISDREQLQRRLALLKMSNGSASEIADLEAQLDETLKNEYFSRQEESLDAIRDASDKQIERLDNQIRIMEENLAYQKENGILWQKVYDVMANDEASILNFISGNNTAFIEKSALEQKEMLNEWAKQIGIYKEDQANKYNTEKGYSIWNEKYRADNPTLSGLTKDQRTKVSDEFASAYAKHIGAGMNEEEATKAAWNDVQQTISNFKSENEKPKEEPKKDNSSENKKKETTKYKKVYITVKAGNLGGTPSPSQSTVEPNKSFTINDGAWTGYEFSYITYNGVEKKSRTITPTGKVQSIEILVYYKNIASKIDKAIQDKLNNTPSNQPGYSEGGIIDYTGTAMVHGSPSKPEAVLNPKQTSAFMELVESFRQLARFDNPLLSFVQSHKDALSSKINNTNNGGNTVTVAPGAVQIAVAQLNDKYDVDELANDIMNRMVVIANKSTNRGVNRR